MTGPTMSLLSTVKSPMFAAERGLDLRRLRLEVRALLGVLHDRQAHQDLVGPGVAERLHDGVAGERQRRRGPRPR